MMRITKKIQAILACVLICVSVSACGFEYPEGWPQEKAFRDIPPVHTGVVDDAIVGQDANGGDYAIIIVKDFSIENMGEYIKILLGNKFSTVSEQTRYGNKATYAAKKKDLQIYMVLKIEEKELRIELE